jgi:hypothetical protein
MIVSLKHSYVRWCVAAIFATALCTFIALITAPNRFFTSSEIQVSSAKTDIKLMERIVDGFVRSRGIIPQNEAELLSFVCQDATFKGYVDCDSNAAGIQLRDTNRLRYKKLDNTQERKYEIWAEIVTPSSNTTIVK